MEESTKGTAVEQLPPEFLTPGSSSFADFLAAHAPEQLPADRRLGGAGDPAGAAVDFPHGTTIVAASYADGVLLAADRRVTLGNGMIAHRDFEKVFPADEFSAVGIAGSTGMAEEMVRLLRLELEHYEKIETVPLSLEGKANRLGTLIRDNLGPAMQGLAVVPIFAGYDVRSGAARIYSYDITGGRAEEKGFGGTGSGSVYARGAMKKLYREGMSEDDAVTMAVQALYDAAEDDSATGGPDATRRIYPLVHTVTAEGCRRLDDARVAELSLAVLEGRRGRPDGPNAPLA
ncbi:proteasome subunit beta [Streptomyces sp. MAR4 CNY-716]